MSRVDPDSLLEPVAPDLPCGPDLDLEGDPAFAALMATVEGQLPSSYFSFDPATIDFEAAFSEGAALLKRTRDVRLLVLLSKLGILNRDLATFSDAIEGIRRLFAERWDSVQPQAVDGDFLARMAPLYTFDDTGPVLMPLQFVPLAETERAGRATYRAHLVSIGEAKAREGETLPDAVALERIFQEVDLDQLRAKHASLVQLKSALTGIRNASVEHAGFEEAVRLEKLPGMIDGMLALVHGALVRRDPTVADVLSEAPAEAEATDDAGSGYEPAPPAPTGMTARDADAMLAVALAYFETREPSSPAIPLLRQARSLVGKNLLEVMRILFPAQADAARIQVGGELPFTVAVGAGGGGAPADDGAAAEPRPPVTSRQAAITLLDQVTGYYRSAEPSSPIPMLLDRARALSPKDFTSLLKELLPSAPVTPAAPGK
jgi:type VI secretion system protein ImpA